MILRFWANGIIPHYEKNYFYASSQCRTDAQPKTRIRSLTLLDGQNGRRAVLIKGIILVLSIQQSIA